MADDFTRSTTGATTDSWEFDLGRNIKITGLGEFQLKIHEFPSEIRKALEIAIRKDADRMRDRSRSLASGDVLQTVTGRYVNSIKSQVSSSDTGVFGSVSSDDPRAKLFEFGGSTPSRDILPT